MFIASNFAYITQTITQTISVPSVRAAMRDLRSVLAMHIKYTHKNDYVATSVDISMLTAVVV
jgi:hypothetical protein